MLERAFKVTLVKFEKTGQLGILPGRGRKRINTAVVEDITTAIVEEGNESRFTELSADRQFHIPLICPIPLSTFVRKILNFYPCKIQVNQQLKPHDPGTRKTFALEFFVRMAVADS
ncbi:hypothetical protein TNCV_553541 [Trichonephila clavipes]|nr:hypothetical protein TNCV_553541 [Trichonephila clavipes]